MKLNYQDKINLLSAAKKVYSAYTALELFKSRTFTTNSGQETVYQLCQQAIQNKKYNQELVLNGLHYQLSLTPTGNNTYTVQMSRLIRGQGESSLKSSESYSDGEALSLLTKQQFSVQANEQNTQLTVSNKINERHSIAGSGKVDLAHSSLISLLGIIKKVEAEEDLSSLLVDLGPNKTQIQALWMLALSVSGHNGVFAVPEQLIKQFITDLKGLLPDIMVDSLLFLREKEASPRAHLALKNLRKPETKGQIIIASSEYLLDEYYDDVEAALSNSTFLSFDEQHLMMETERRRVRLIELAKQKLTMFLTTTPSQETYALSRHKSGESSSVSDKNNLKSYSDKELEELGKKLSQQIIVWVYTHFDEDETINPDHLKRQVLRFIVQALREINNKNDHQIKLSRAQLSKVVAYTMQGLDRQMAQIDKPYPLSFFKRTLSYVLNFIGESYYLFKRIPAALQLYYYSWFAKRDEHNLSSQGTKHADDVYIKIIQSTSFKELVAERSVVRELKNWFAQKSKGLFTQLNKNRVDYLKEESVHSYQLHQKQFLESLLIHSVVDAKKKQVIDALTVLPSSSSFFHARISLLKALYIEKKLTSLQFKTSLLSFLHEIPGLYELQQEDLVCYPEKVDLVERLSAQSSLQTAAQMPELQKSISIRLALYLQNEFAKSLPAFVSYSHAVLIQNELAKERNAALFAEYFLKKLSTGANFSLEFLLSELKSFFKLDQIKFFGEDLQSVQSELIKIQEQVATNVIACLDETHLEKIATLIGEQLVPQLVILYPKEARSGLFVEASNKEKIKAFLLKQGNQLTDWSALNNQQLAQLIFSQLTTGELPAPLQFEQEIAGAKTFIAEQFQTIRNKGLVGLVAGKLLAPSSWNFNSNYLYDKAIADLLQSEVFFNALSLMLPYDQWLKLRADVNKNYSTLISIAHELIDQMSSREGATPTPEDLLSLFNKHFKTTYECSEQASEKTQIALGVMIKRISDKPLEQVSDTLKNQLVTLGLEQVLPILASFIKEDKKKQVFLNLNKERTVVYDFMVQEVQSLISLNKKQDPELQQLVLQLINKLMPTGEHYTLSDLHNPSAQTQQLREQINNEIQQKIIIAFLSSAPFHEMLRESFNEADYKLLLNILSIDRNILELAEQLIKEQKTLNQDQVLIILKAQHPSLVVVQPLRQRAQDFSLFLDHLDSNLGSYLEKTKFSALMADSFVPVLFHSQLLESIDNVLGFLEEEELIVLFTAMGKLEPVKEAQDYLRFLSILKKQDKESLTREFMVLPQDLSHFDLEQVPAKKMLSTISELMDEVLDCHCSYTGQDREGSLGTVHAKIHSQLSPELTKITSSSDDGFFNRFARKALYTHGIQQGLDAKGEIHADANHYKLAALQKVKTHILQPLWLGSNVSNLTHSFIKGGRDFIWGCESAWSGFINAIKSTFNWFTKNTYFKISTENPDDIDFNNTTFDFTESLNKLTPLSQKEAIEAECPVDVVTHLEDFISKRSPRLGFFSGNLGRVQEDSESLTSSPKF